MTQQAQWHFCQQCNNMFFGGDRVNAGRCVNPLHNDGAHTAQGFEFTLPFVDGPEGPSTQKDWFFCRKCNCMVFIAVGGDAGACAAGGGHESTGSFNFHLPHDIPEAPGSQQNWRFCRNCGILHFGRNTGRCVKGGTHDGTDSFNFVLPHNEKFTTPPHKIDEGSVGIGVDE